MDNKRLSYLLERYHTSACTGEELAELNDWFHTLNYSSQNFETWVQEAGGNKQMADALFANFEQKVKPRARVLSMPRVLTGVAAAVLLLLAISILVVKKPPVKNPGLAHTKTNRITPGKNQAYLTLANGSKIILDDASKGQLATQAGITITKKANGLIIYGKAAGAKPTAADAIAYNTIETPRGGQYQVQLPDGSNVWLNAASKLRYPVKFGTKERLVELTGEAYFEVAHNKNLPFKVHTGDQEVKVLGTHFNINGYADDPGVLTTLVEGSVMLSKFSSGQSHLLLPGQQGSILNNQQQIVVKQVNVKQDITTVMKMLSRWYDVDVDYKTIDKTERFGGSFSRYSNIADILNSLEVVGKVRFKIDKRRIIVSE
jgi:transmembrane sensor